MKEKDQLDKAIAELAVARDHVAKLSDELEAAKTTRNKAENITRKTQLAYDMTRETCKLLNKSRFRDTVEQVGVVTNRTKSGKTITVKIAGDSDDTGSTCRQSKYGDKSWDEYPHRANNFNGAWREIELG